MLDAETEQALARGCRSHQGGQLADAERIYREVLGRHPDHPDALHLLGVIALQTGKLDAAIELIGRALTIRPNDAVFRANLGGALRERGRLDEALAHFSKAVSLDPRFAAAYASMGGIFALIGRWEEAIAACSEAIRLDPGNAEARGHLGSALLGQRKPAQAAAAFRASIRIRPTPESYHNLGAALQCLGELDDARQAYDNALRLKEDFPEACNNLGNVLRDQRRLDEASAAFTRAVRLKPDFATALNNLASVLKDQAKLEEALACFSRAMELDGRNPMYHSNRVYLLHFHPGFDSTAILREQLEWDRRHGQPFYDQLPRHQEPPAGRAGQAAGPEGAAGAAPRRLRIGYVSPDLRAHVVGRNLVPLFRQRDRDRFEVFCYSDVVAGDALTARFRSWSDAWRDIAALNHDDVARQVRSDRIDILVDLSLHMGANRLPLFARKPAPVQVTFAGYPAGTGLRAMDFRLTDPWLDPPGISDGDYVEQSLRFGPSFWCYDPEVAVLLGETDPPVNPLPALQNGFIRFGSLNNFCKINDQVLALWAQVLQSVAGSRLVLLTADGRHRQMALDRLAGEGIDPGRVEFVALQPRPQYLECYHRIDIGLDTLPYNGHSTSLDAYWMGVPVVTLVGKTVVGRAGLSQLTNLGLPDLAAHTPQEYVQIVTKLASDLGRLSELRATLRGRMRESPLTDAAAFARNVEAAFVEMWGRRRG